MVKDLGSGYEEFSLLGCSAVQSIESHIPEDRTKHTICVCVLHIPPFHYFLSN
jgi:hypothetical protein